jgi:hypothetical protein
MENKQDRPPEAVSPDAPEPMPDDWRGKTEHSKDEAVVKPGTSDELPPEDEGQVKE